MNYSLGITIFSLHFHSATNELQDIV